MIRFEWGPTGAAAIAEGADVAVVVDVLSFTTTVSVALERGITVRPYPWRDDHAASDAAEHGAVLAGKRGAEPVSLSPAHMSRATNVERVVLPSPNGSSICFALADAGVTVVAACLRNRRAVAAWLAEEWPGATVAVVAAGERWPDGSLRPAVEDLWGAGAVLAVLADLGATAFSTEAGVAEAAFRAVEADVPSYLTDCVSGRELVDKGFAEDVDVAAALDVSAVVPLLRNRQFGASPTPPHVPGR